MFFVRYNFIDFQAFSYGILSQKLGEIIFVAKREIYWGYLTHNSMPSR
jgi:hypothetical protein